MPHSLRTFTSSIDKIFKKMVEMGKFVCQEWSLAFASESVKVGVYDLDKKVDEYDADIHYRVSQLIMLQPPLPKELKSLSTMMRISRELERAGDYAVNIVDLHVHHELGLESVAVYQLNQMGNRVLKMLDDCLIALEGNDRSRAAQIITQEQEVDRLFVELQEVIIREMQENRELIEKLAYYFLINRFIERGADHISNVARLIHYISY